MQEYFRLRRPPSLRFKDLQASVEARIRYDALPFEFRCDILRVSRDWLLCPVTLEIAHRDLEIASGPDGAAHADVNVYGRVERLSRQVAYEFEDVVSAELSARAPGARSLYQRHLPLEPGRYKLTLALKCLQTGRMGTAETLVVVPAPTGGLETSSLLPARRIGAARAGETFPAPFTTTGGLKVYPNVSGAYAPGEPVALYAEVYNPAVDAASRQPATRVVAEIAPEGAGAPIVSEDVTAGATVFDGAKISIAKMWSDLHLQPGRYVLRLRVDDTLGNQSRVSSTPFRVTPPPPPPPSAGPR
jgi:hypothetical protein